MANSRALVTRPDVASGVVKRVESKSEKFIRLANIRASDAIAAIDRLGNLSGSDYEYSEAQITKLAAAVNGASKRAFDRLRSRQAKPRQAATIL